MPLDITLPMMLVEQGLQSKQSWWLSVIGRLAPGATAEQARADLEALWDGYMTEVGMTREQARLLQRHRARPRGQGHQPPSRAPTPSR